MKLRHTLTSVLSGILAFTLLIVGGPRAVAAGSPTGDKNISDTLEHNLQGGEGNLAAFVYDNGTTRFGGLGADENTEFEIGSITKTFNAELLRQQIEAGKISLNTTVGDLIDVPGAPIADVTMEELVNHTSGLASVPSPLLSNTLGSLLWQANPYCKASAQDILDYAGQAKLTNQGEVSYSNYGHALLGQLLALNAHTSYEELLRTRIFEPAGMTSTYLALPGTTDSAPKRLGMNGQPVEAWEMDGWAPCGAIRSTAADMAKYVAWIDHHGRPDYGWFDYPRDGTNYPFHNGGTGGFRTMLVWDPNNSHRAAFVANASTTPVEDLGVDLLNASKAR